MEDDQQSPDESGANKLAAFLRDCLVGLVVLAMIGWLVFVGFTAVVRGHLDLLFSPTFSTGGCGDS